MRFSAVDIGSNAIRMLFSEVYKNNDGEDVFRKLSLIRLPIRLGEDSFMHGKIKKARAEKLLKTIRAYQLLNEVYEVVDYQVCATSAMRDAENSSELIDMIKKETGVEIEVIKGKREAEIIYENHVAESLNSKGCYLYVDVGGGSTELSIFKRGQRLESESFDIGTIRMKNDLVKQGGLKISEKMSKPLSMAGAVRGIGKNGKTDEQLQKNLLTFSGKTVLIKKFVLDVQK